MSVNVRVLKAFHGDCIFITVDSGTVTERILIDGGPEATFGVSPQGELRCLLNELEAEGKQIDLVMLTHVDDDHIGGLIKAFEVKDGLTKLARKVIFNSGQLIHDYFKVPIDPNKDILGNFTQSQNTSFKQGNTLEQLLKDLRIWHRNVIKQGDKISLQGCELIYLTPNEAELKKLLVKWEKEQSSPFTSASNTDWKKSYKELIDQDSFKEDNSKPNGSSISFILKVGEKNFLFLGDAHPTSITQGLAMFGYNADTPINAEMVKLSHHGSKGNTSLELLCAINSSNYIVSTDATRHGLPNKTTFARIHNKNSNAVIFFNYKSVISSIYTKDELAQLKERVMALSGELSFA
ncbi:TPA: ComEC/Rec2 family competence protein [Serratia marcescens]